MTDRTRVTRVTELRVGDVIEDPARDGEPFIVRSIGWRGTDLVLFDLDKTLHFKSHEQVRVIPDRSNK